MSTNTRPTDTELLDWFEANCWSVSKYTAREPRGWQVSGQPDVGYQTAREAIAAAMPAGGAPAAPVPDLVTAAERLVAALKREREERGQPGLCSRYEQDVRAALAAMKGGAA